jgi:TRAP-type transport system periplasmic protein
MKKIYLFFLIVPIFLFAIVSNGIAAEPITIKFAHGGPPNPLELPEQSNAVVFKDYVESRSGGRIKVDIYPSCQLGSEREMLEGINLGTIEMANTSEGALAGFYPDILATAVPYAFKNQRIAWEVLEGPYGQELREDILKSTGMRALTFSDNGFRNFTNSIRPIRTPEDLKGLKIRTMENPAHMKLVEALGAIPTPIAWAETYNALQSGVVDGQENPVNLIVTQRIYEVNKYTTLDGHIFSIDFIWINEVFYQSLAPDLQQIVTDGAIQATLVQRGMKILTDTLGLDKIKEQGVEVYTPSDEELAQFKEAAQKPVLEWLKTQVKEEAIDKFLNAIDEAEKRVLIK